jgi:hypothetical protein
VATFERQRRLDAAFLIQRRDMLVKGCCIPPATVLSGAVYTRRSCGMCRTCICWSFYEHGLKTLCLGSLCMTRLFQKVILTLEDCALQLVLEIESEKQKKRVQN